MASHVHTRPDQVNALGEQACPLFGAGRVVGRQGQPSVGAYHAMPGQAGIGWQLSEYAPDPAGCTAESSTGGQFAIAGHPSRRHPGQAGEKRLAPLHFGVSGLSGRGPFALYRRLAGG